MAHYAALFRQHVGWILLIFPAPVRQADWGAALGGVLGAGHAAGIDAMLDLVGFDELIDGADLW